jgi:hypothetical protein
VKKTSDPFFAEGRECKQEVVVLIVQKILHLESRAPIGAKTARKCIALGKRQFSFGSTFASGARGKKRDLLESISHFVTHRNRRAI